MSIATPHPKIAVRSSPLSRTRFDFHRAQDWLDSESGRTVRCRESPCKATPHALRRKAGNLSTRTLLPTSNLNCRSPTPTLDLPTFWSPRTKVAAALCARLGADRPIATQRRQRRQKCEKIGQEGSIRSRRRIVMKRPCKLHFIPVQLHSILGATPIDPPCNPTWRPALNLTTTRSPACLATTHLPRGSEQVYRQLSPSSNLAVHHHVAVSICRTWSVDLQAQHGRRDPRRRSGHLAVATGEVAKAVEAAIRAGYRHIVSTPAVVHRALLADLLNLGPSFHADRTPHGSTATRRKSDRASRRPALRARSCL